MEEAPTESAPPSKMAVSLALSVQSWGNEVFRTNAKAKNREEIRVQDEGSARVRLTKRQYVEQSVPNSAL